MGAPSEIPISPLPLERFRPLLGAERVDSALALARRVADRLGGRPIWNVNSTAVGGGVAEMLRPLLSYARGAGVQTRWMVIAGGRDFFHVTKRLHNALHGERGDGSSLGSHAREIYVETLRENARQLLERMKPGELVILHDPQTAGLAPLLLSAGLRVIWRCHVGSDQPSPESERGWRFLLPDLVDVPRLIFSRRAYAPRELDARRVVVVEPSIDPFSPKNEELDAPTCLAILRCVGLVEGAPEPGRALYLRSDGSTAQVHHAADVMRLGRLPCADDAMVVQVSRWDRLKDPVGVLRGFEQLLGTHPQLEAELVLAGPNVHAVADDPEGAQVFNEVLEAWRTLPHEVRRHVTLASLPTHDVDENAAIVNALQRHARVVVQKSLREGFGLTVTEAMWKARPVVASRLGGIQDQIDDGVNGLLLEDPADEREFAAALLRLLTDHGLAARLGQNARLRVRDHFLLVRHLVQYGELLERQ